MKINKSNIDKLEAKTIDAIYFDDELKGFGVKVTKTGKKSFIVMKRIDSSKAPIKIKIGDCNVYTPEQAKKEALKILGDFSKGINPSAEKKKDEIYKVTLRQAFDEYIKSSVRANRTNEEYKREFEYDLEQWHNTPLNDITREMVLDWYKEKSKAAKVQADKTTTLLKSIYNFAIENYRADNKPVIFDNPCNVFKVHKKEKAQPRKDIVEVEQLPKLWEALELVKEDSTKLQSTKILCKLCLLTGCREQEICTLRKKDIDFKNKFIFIGNTKNHEPHTIPYGTYVGELINDLCEEKENSDFLFPADNKHGHLKDHSKYINMIKDKAGLYFCLKELRHTMTTYASVYLHIDSKIVDVMTNHKSKDVTFKHYVRRGTKEFDQLRGHFQEVENFILTNIANKNTTK